MLKTNIWKVEADDADPTWFDCVRNDTAALVVVDETERALAETRSEVNEPFHLHEDWSAFSFKVAKASSGFIAMSRTIQIAMSSSRTGGGATTGPSRGAMRQRRRWWGSRMHETAQ